MPNGVSEWILIAGALSMLLFGGGGVVAWMKQRRDAKAGVRQENRADVDSLNAQAIAIVENQFNYLVKPLKEEVDKLKGEVKELRTEAENTRTKYWKAITHIRVLYSWIAKHMPAEVEVTMVPAPPEDLADDI